VEKTVFPFPHTHPATYTPPSLLHSPLYSLIFHAIAEINIVQPGKAEKQIKNSRNKSPNGKNPAETNS